MENFVRETMTDNMSNPPVNLNIRKETTTKLYIPYDGTLWHIFLKLKYSWFTILVYSMIQYFIKYSAFKVITKYDYISLCCTIYTWDLRIVVGSSGLHLLIPHPFLASPHWCPLVYFSVSVSVSLYTCLFYFLDSTYKR